MERMGFVGIIIEDRAAVPMVNEILSGYSEISQTLGTTIAAVTAAELITCSKK